MTPIQQMKGLYDQAIARQDRVDEANKDKGRDGWAFGSRAWSRQLDGLRLAIVAEPPTNAEEAALVLEMLCAQRIDIEDSDDATPAQLREMRELTDVVLANCAVLLASGGVCPPDRVSWLAARQRQWLPAQDEAA